MKKFGIFFGSSTGTTEEIAHKIAGLLNIDSADVHNVATTAPDAVADYEVLLLGSSTWGSGELQDDWYDFLTGLEALDLKGKKIAIFGLGDESMSDTFCNAVGIIHKSLQPTGATFIGRYPDSVYHFEESEANENGEGLGLLLDEVNHPELTDERLKGWVAELEAQTK